MFTDDSGKSSLMSCYPIDRAILGQYFLKMKQIWSYAVIT